MINETRFLAVSVLVAHSRFISARSTGHGSFVKAVEKKATVPKLAMKK